MKFCYRYRGSDNVQRSGVVSAPSRDDAFRALRADGIRAYDVTLAPGFLNRLASFGKRGLAIVVLSLALAVSVWFAYATRTVPARFTALGVMPRHQIAGLPSEWMDQASRYLTSATDVFLARYAQPGVVQDASGRIESGVLASSFGDDLSVPLVAADDDPAWVSELKQILNGMKEEALALVQAGKTPTDISLWLEERQKMEASYRNQILEGPGTDEEKRARLKAMNL